MPPRQLAVRIAGTATVAPGRAVSTAEVAARVSPPRPGRRRGKNGHCLRRFAHPDESPAELGAEACGARWRRRPRARGLERVIVVTSGGGDLAFPATANLVAAGLGLAGSCDCFDLNNACMGFLTALDIGARSIVTGGGPVGIAVIELASRAITPDDPRPYLVFGDGVAAAVLTAATAGAAIVGSYLWNDGIAFGNVRLDNPIVTHRRETIRFTASNAQMGHEAIAAVLRSPDVVLARAGLTAADIDWVVPHQPNGVLLAAMMDALGVAPERVVPVVREIGSVGAASIPIRLDRLLRTRPVRDGDHVLMVGVGGGVSSGAILYRVGV